MRQQRRERQQVAQNASAGMLAKFDERVARVAAEQIRVAPHATARGVLRTVTDAASAGGGRVHHCLMGLHRGMTFYDDDCQRTPIYTPPGSTLRFRLGTGTSLYENMPGLVPVACTCTDYLTRCTSSTSGAGGIRSVDHANLRGAAGIMGAALGCKHMLACERYLARGTGTRAYFDVPRHTGKQAS